VFRNTPPYRHMVDAKHHVFRFSGGLAFPRCKGHGDRVLYREVAVQKQRADIMEQTADKRLFRGATGLRQPSFGQNLARRSRRNRMFPELGPFRP